MSAADASKALGVLLAKLFMQDEPGLPAVPECGIEPLIYEFVRSFLIWEATESKAQTAMERLLAGVVDCNELRICLPNEVHGLIGERYPLGKERTMRLRAALNELYEREHDVSIERLRTMNKRDARAYLLSLDGVPPFVAARVILLGLGGHAFPIDKRLVKLLAGEGVLEPKLSPEIATSRMERMLRAGEATNAYLAIEAWAEKAPTKRATKTAKKGATKKSRTKAKKD